MAEPNVRYWHNADIAMHSANCAGVYRDLAIVGRKTSKIEQPSRSRVATSGFGAFTLLPEVPLWADRLV